MFKKGFLTSLLFLTQAFILSAQTNGLTQDSLFIDIKLKDGSVAKGRVIEQLDGPRAVFKTTNGNLYVVSKDNTEEFELDREKLAELIKEGNINTNSGSNGLSDLFSNPYWGFGFRYRTIGSGPFILYLTSDYGDRIPFSIQEISSAKFSFEYLVGFDFPVSGFVYFDYASDENTEKNSRRVWSSLNSKPDSAFNENISGYENKYSETSFTFGAGLRYQGKVNLGSGYAKPGFSLFAGKKTTTYKSESKDFPVIQNPNSGVIDNYDDATSDLNSPWQIGVEVSAEYFFNQGLSLVAGYQVIRYWSETTYKRKIWNKTTFYNSQTSVMEPGMYYQSNDEKVSFDKWVSQTHIGLNFYF